MVTLKDIARASGVSTATVSYVLNDGPKSVLPATRERVLKVMGELGYRRNAAALGLLGKRTHTIGVVFPHEHAYDEDNLYFSTVMKGVMDVATSRKQVLMLFTGMTWQEVERNVPQFFDGRCDGFIFVAPPAKCAFLSDIAKRNKKVVILGTRAPELSVTAIDADNVKGSRLATKHLIALGHKRIGFITGDSSSTSSPERLRGYRAEMALHGLHVERGYVEYGAYNDADAETAVRALLARQPQNRLTAVVCAQDGIAAALLKVASELGIAVPTDLSVVGFDDLAMAARLSPALTTVHHPIRKIGASAALTLLGLIEGDIVPPREELFDVHLVERDSTGAPALAS